MPLELRRAVDAALEASGSDRGEGAAEDVAVGAAEDVVKDVAEDVAEDVADRLAEAGLATLGRVVAASQTRGTAEELLAADALLTYACEAAADAGLDTLERLVGRLDLDRFAALLETRSP